MIESAFDGTVGVFIGFVFCFVVFFKRATTYPMWAAPFPHVPSFMTEP